MSLFQELIDTFKELNIEGVDEHVFTEYANKLIDSNKDQYPTLEHVFNTTTKNDIIRRTLDLYSKETGNENPHTVRQSKIAKDHPFFKNRSYVCAAPYTTLRFNTLGVMNVCCANTEYILGHYPAVKPMNAWFGVKLNKLRQALSNHDFSLGCMKCANFILNDTGHRPLLMDFDTPDVKQQMRAVFPSSLVFQLHNICNLECITCGGMHSSSIRKNRDFLPPIPNVYGEEFLDDILPFIKNAKHIEFLGGEPFLISTTYRLLELIIEHNPSCIVFFTTNGTVYNSKIEKILQSLPNARVFVSIDSINPETYAFMRRKSDLRDVLKNIDSFLKLNIQVGISVCPIIQNVYELPQIIEYAIEKKLLLWIAEVDGVLGSKMYEDLYENGNTKVEVSVERKEAKIPEFRLWKLSIEEKEKIKTYLQTKSYPKEYQQHLDSFIGFLMSN
jgi:MoaA/NifB/PqqE/SkfB family radical SAM enzyme